jgi:hypothetical protein
MALIQSYWRAWLALAVLGFAVASACQGYRLAAVAAFAVLLTAEAWLLGGAFTEARAMTREPAGGRHRRCPDGPGASLEQAYICSRCHEPGVTTWDSEQAMAEGQGLDLVCDACLVGRLRLVAQAFSGAAIKV